jgi:hypothetical protein
MDTVDWSCYRYVDVVVDVDVEQAKHDVVVADDVIVVGGVATFAGGAKIALVSSSFF